MPAVWMTKLSCICFVLISFPNGSRVHYWHEESGAPCVNHACEFVPLAWGRFIAGHQMLFFREKLPFSYKYIVYIPSRSLFLQCNSELLQLRVRLTLRSTRKKKNRSRVERKFDPQELLDYSRITSQREKVPKRPCSCSRNHSFHWKGAPSHVFNFRVGSWLSHASWLIAALSL